MDDEFAADETRQRVVAPGCYDIMDRCHAAVLAAGQAVRNARAAQATAQERILRARIIQEEARKAVDIAARLRAEGDVRRGPPAQDQAAIAALAVRSEPVPAP